jgi:PrgI family protein
MATYKVIQDIEAEDKFLGPLTLKQFIFACGGTFFGWLCFVSVVKGFWPAVVIFGPLMFAGFALAFPWSKDQPTDVWLAAKFRFHFGAKKRIWDQSGVHQLVTVTAPKKIEKILTNSLSQHEVKSRLQALAETIDSRGWAVKNAGLPESYGSYSDRLVAPIGTQQNNLTEDTPDMFETRSDTVEAGLRQSAQMQRQRNIDKLNLIRQGEPLETVNAIVDATYAPPAPSFSFPEQNNPPSTPQNISFNTFSPSAAQTDIIPTQEEMQLLEQLRAKQNATKNNLHDRSQNIPPTPINPDIIYGNNLSVETIQKEAQKERSISSADESEVVIPLR